MIRLFMSGRKRTPGTAPSHGDVVLATTAPIASGPQAARNPNASPAAGNEAVMR